MPEMLKFKDQLAKLKKNRKVKIKEIAQAIVNERLLITILLVRSSRRLLI